MKSLPPLLLPLLLVFINADVKVNKGCEEDNCALDRAELSLKMAVGILKLVRDENKVEGNNGKYKTINNEERKKARALTLTSAKRSTLSNTTSVSSTGYHPTDVSTKKRSATSWHNDRSNKNCSLPPTSCAEIQVQGHRHSGVYEIYPKWERNPVPTAVYCDLSTEGGGWTVIQRRNDYNTGTWQPFAKTWAEYKKGFGDLKHEFWLGNDLIHNLTRQERTILRLDVEDWEGQKRFSHYRGFYVAGAAQRYRMDYSAYYDSTTGGDGFESYIKGGEFYTVDSDTSNKPAAYLNSGFWFQNYHGSYMNANPNGVYYSKGNHLSKSNGIYHNYFRGKAYSLKRFEMKLRPEYFSPPDQSRRLKLT